MTSHRSLALMCVVLISSCGDDDTGGSTTPDAGAHAMHRDGGGDDAGTCRSDHDGTLRVEVAIESGVQADVDVLREDGSTVGDAITATTSRELSAGTYRIAAHRVRASGDLVGPAYQAAVSGSAKVCGSETTTIHVTYTREPGSARLWLTQGNGDGAQVTAFDASQLADLGDQPPSVSLAPGLPNAGPIRVDGKGRLWVGTNTGKLVAYESARLGTNSTSAPDIELDGSSLCEDEAPCGPRALAFDSKGALWVATLHRVVKLAPDSLEHSGQPTAAVTLNSSDSRDPRALAFDASGNLWIADGGGAVLMFQAAHLAHDSDAAADIVIFTQQPGPVMSTLGEPEGLAVDRDGNLWVGYFTGNDLVRLSRAELAASALESNPLTPSMHMKVGVEALVTDLALDESGNLWMPGGSGSLYRIARGELSSETPSLSSLRGAGIGTVEKLTFNTTPGPLFVAP